MIEILVVAFIVSLMAVLALASYGTSRQKARMDFAADSLVSLVGQQKSSARGGRQTGSGAAGEPTCYGVGFSTGSGDNVEIVEAPYVSVDLNVSKDKGDFCNMAKSVKRPFDQFENNKITSVLKYGMPVQNIILMFRPPEGRISFGDANPDYTGNPKVTVTFASAGGNDRRSFAVDITSGLAERVETPILKKVSPAIANPTIQNPALNLNNNQILNATKTK